MRLTLTARAVGQPRVLPQLARSFSLQNTNFVVLVAFILFIAVLFYFKVPGMIGAMLDKRADGIRTELEEARALREEAQTLLASYERKQKEVQEQADRIVAAAKEEARARPNRRATIWPNPWSAVWRQPKTRLRRPKRRQ